MTTESDPPRSELARRPPSDPPYTPSQLQAQQAIERSELEDPRMRAPRISREEVYGAADALLVEGQRPTIDRVRMRLGRGSPNTINDHLDGWWLKLGSRLRDLPGREFPQLPERVAGTLHGLWNEALDAAHSALTASLTEREERLIKDEQRLEAERATLEQERRTAEARAGALDQGLAIARSQLENANRRVQVFDETLSEREAERRQLMVRVEELEDSLTESHTRADAERQAASAERERLEARHTAAENRWLTEVDRARQEMKTSEQRASELKKQLAESRQQMVELTQDVQELREALTVSEAGRAELQERLRAHRAQPPRKRARRAKKSSR